METTRETASGDGDAALGSGEGTSGDGDGTLGDGEGARVEGYLEREMAVRCVFAYDLDAQLIDLFPLEIPNWDFGVAAWNWAER
jgi:hypothetical protein